jgi:DNA-binding MarR family transcriptional regulator
MFDREQARGSAAARAGAPPRVHAAHLLSRAGRAQSARLTERLAALDLRPKHFALLNRIALAEGSSQQQLGRSLELDPSALVATIDDLERQGLAERRRHPTDRRCHALYLTPAGQATLRQARAAARRTAEHLLAALSDEQIASLNELLETVVADLDRGLDDAAKASAPDVKGAARP